MQLAGLNDITNFGKVIYKIDTPNRKFSKKQENCREIFERKLFLSNLESKLDDVDTDIIFHAKSNGGVSLSLSKKLNSWFEDIPNQKYIPTDKNENPIIQVNYLSKPKNRNCEICFVNNFLAKCQEYLNYMSKSNKEKEDNWESRMENIANKRNFVAYI